MHLKLLVLFFISLPISVFSNLKPFELDEKFETIADVIHDIVDEFFIKEHMHFHMIVFRNLTESSIEVYDKFLSKNNEKFKKTLLVHRKSPEFQKFVFFEKSAILFLRSLDDIIDIENFYHILRNDNDAIKYFIFIPNLSYLELRSAEILKQFEYLIVISDYILQYAFFITNEPNTVTLSTIEWFSPPACGHGQLTIVNVFDKWSKKWLKKLENYEKFLQYNGCELTLMVSASSDGINKYVSNYAIIKEDMTSFEVKGIVPEIFKIASEIHNFTTSYQPAEIKLAFLLLPEKNCADLLPINGTEKIPHVFFISIQSNIFKNTLFVKRTHSFVDMAFHIFVTPGEAYTPYEKLFLPFDVETWMLLIATFLATFLSILIINRLSKSTQTIVYGHGVDTPFWNVVSIFFGISLTRLPRKNFSRFILIFFVFFCLIFRTCYQSKMYEFMTSVPRRPPPKTIEDLISQNYTLVLMESNNIQLEITDIHGRSPRIKSVNIFDFHSFLISQSQNASAKLALLVDEFFQNHVQKNESWKNDWIQFKEPYFVSHDSFGFNGAAFYLRMFSKLINRLIDTGVMKYLSDNYYSSPRSFDPTEEGPEVLKLDDMKFGFNIWLGFCGISFASLIGEVIFKKITTKEQKKMRFAKIYPLNLDENDPVCTLKAETIKIFKLKTETKELNSPKSLKTETKELNSPKSVKTATKEVSNPKSVQTESEDNIHIEVVAEIHNDMNALENKAAMENRDDYQLATLKTNCKDIESEKEESPCIWLLKNTKVVNQLENVDKIESSEDKN